MNRYEEANENLVMMFLKVVEERFPQFQGLNIKLLFDTKKRVGKGKVVLASIETTNDKIKFFSKDNVAVDGYEYVLVVDKKAWELANTTDKERLISHEMRHIYVDENESCKILGHEVEDFYAEIELNQDDPEWARKLVILVTDVYEQEKEMKKGTGVLKVSK